MTLDSENKGNPVVISDTEGEDITPENPEIIQQFPVDLSDKEAVRKVEEEPQST